MDYSKEEIFIKVGQYDTFVELTFETDSEAFKRFGRILLGTFKYTKTERDALIADITKTPVPSTNGYTKFYPSDVPKELSDALKTDLDKTGILNTDIVIIADLGLPKTNRYTTEGEREIMNKLIVEFDSGGLTVDQMKLGNLRMRLAGGYPLIDEELEKYIGLELFHNPKRLTEPMTAKIGSGATLNKNIRYYFLDTKWYHDKLTPEETKEHNQLQTERSKNVFEILRAELQRSNENLKSLAANYSQHFQRILLVCVEFETGVILPYKFPIWWNLERFLHIYLRHVKETNVGAGFIGKSLFRYSFKDVRRIVSAVIQKVYPDIVEHFKDGNQKVFFRQGERAVYHDGVYYYMEIEPSGLLRTFYPVEKPQQTN